MRWMPALLLVSLASIAAAQTPAPLAPPMIQVMGVGRVSVPPDVATIQFELRGEGATAAAAGTTLAEKQRALVAGFAKQFARAKVETSNTGIQEARAKACDNQTYRPRLSTGDCAIEGYISTLTSSVRMASPKDAATAASLLGSLGATNVRLTGFTLVDRTAAERAATKAALAEARAEAEAIAAASGTKLGALLLVRDGSMPFYQADMMRSDIIVSANAAPPPPPPPPPPFAVEVTPRPIDVEVRLAVSYLIGG
ncbi:SIMPL domain-containing protein [Sphingomonas naphthae]|uniref:SIMPL domain-containing protein n=1 Tax=Sphingomonas naphthae TaxID=1813468 RepID=A0ABY7TM08_9SPHN|nr:SIMPL domain-containing protein [Sphingomonas naphthae]WCT74033.1 SIMPL domain-containing protein [Sphingomonas naphthae]